MIYNVLLSQAPKLQKPEMAYLLQGGLQAKLGHERATPCPDVDENRCTRSTFNSDLTCHAPDPLYDDVSFYGV